MPSHHTPLLATPNGSPSPGTLLCKVLCVPLALAAIICSVTLLDMRSTSFTGFELSTGHDDVTSFSSSSYLCMHSPAPNTCHGIVSLVSGGGLDAAGVVHGIIRRSLEELEYTVAVAGRTKNGGSRMEEAAMADCMELFHLSSDRLRASDSAVAGGSYTDARTWLSAVLANHVTCRDGLRDAGKVTSPLDRHLCSLLQLASASLAVIATFPEQEAEDLLHQPVVGFPSWVTPHDRKLMQVQASSPSPANGPAANVVVAKDGTGKYTKVQDAVDAAPNKSQARYVIYVKAGVYKETVRVPSSKTNLMIVGDGMAASVITGSLNNVDGTTTFNSATLAAVADGFILQDIGIANTAGAAKHQAVALRVGADKSVINRCQIDGYQDTLYAHTLRQFYRDCVISGTVDFIFGDAAVVIQNSNIVARRPMDNQQNTITAQGREDPNENTGTSIQNCQVVAGTDLKPVQGKIPSYLGRPWKLYSRTVFMQSFIDGLVNAKGWLPWDGDFALKTLYYGEYMNRGPGAGTAGRVNWGGYHIITDAKTAQAFTVAQLIQGGAWIANTGVAFTEGL